jgi:hypothetical protein
MAEKSFFKKYPKLALVLFNLFVFFIIFLLFEIGLRIFTPGWLDYRMKSLQTGEMNDFGGDAGWKVDRKDGAFYSFTPNSTFKMYAFEYENMVHINGLGGRASVENEEMDTAAIIPFTGDSFVFGVGVSDTQNIVALSKQKLGYNFLNLGVTGSAMHFQRKIIDARYEELGKPGLVLFGFFTGNDFSDIVMEREKVGGNNNDSVQPVVVAKQNAITDQSLTWKINYFINQNAILKNLYSLQFIKQKLLNIKNKGAEKIMEKIFYVIDPANKDFLEKSKIEMEKEVQELSKRPYKSAVVIFPDRNQVDEELRKNLSGYYDLDFNSLQPMLPNKMLIEILEKYGIPYIDPTACMISHNKDGKLYYTQDNHLTPLGQQVFFNCISNNLQSIIAGANLPSSNLK